MTDSTNTNSHTTPTIPTILITPCTSDIVADPVPSADITNSPDSTASIDPVSIPDAHTAPHIQDRVLGMILGSIMGDIIGAADGKISVLDALAGVGWSEVTEYMLMFMQSHISSKLVTNHHDLAARIQTWAKNKGYTAHMSNHPAYCENPLSATFDIWSKYGRVFAPSICLAFASLASTLPTIENSNFAPVNIVSLSSVDPRCMAACSLHTAVIYYLLHRNFTAPTDVDQLLQLVVNIAKNFLSVTPILKYQTVSWTDADNQLITDYNGQLSHLIQIAYTAESISALTSDKLLAANVFKSISYTAYVLKIIKVALKNCTTISFRKAIQYIAAHCGSNIDCSLAGAVLGAYLGFSRLPAEWSRYLTVSDELSETVQNYISLLNVVGAPTSVSNMPTNTSTNIPDIPTYTPADEHGLPTDIPTDIPDTSADKSGSSTDTTTNTITDTTTDTPNLPSLTEEELAGILFDKSCDLPGNQN